MSRIPSIALATMADTFSFQKKNLANWLGMIIGMDRSLKSFNMALTPGEVKWKSGALHRDPMDEKLMDMPMVIGKRMTLLCYKLVAKKVKFWIIKIFLRLLIIWVQRTISTHRLSIMSSNHFSTDSTTETTTTETTSSTDTGKTINFIIDGHFSNIL